MSLYLILFKGENMEQDSYIEWVMSVIEKYKKDVSIIHNGEVPPYEIQRLLADYYRNHLALIAEYQRNKRSISTIKRQYNAWWNSKVSSARQELLSKMPAGKFPALKEYSIKAQQDNEEDYNDWQEKIQQAEDKTDFMKTLLDSWSSFLNVLINLNKNMTAELRSLTVDYIQRDDDAPKTRKPRG